jgi:hypothetical protein
MMRFQLGQGGKGLGAVTTLVLFIEFLLMLGQQFIGSKN